jgi:hypothetical protein
MPKHPNQHDHDQQRVSAASAARRWLARILKHGERIASPPGKPARDASSLRTRKEPSSDAP